MSNSSYFRVYNEKTLMAKVTWVIANFSQAFKCFRSIFPLSFAYTDFLRQAEVKQKKSSVSEAYKRPFIASCPGGRGPERTRVPWSSSSLLEKFTQRVRLVVHDLRKKGRADIVHHSLQVRRNSVTDNFACSSLHANHFLQKIIGNICESRATIEQNGSDIGKIDSL